MCFLWCVWVEISEFIKVDKFDIIYSIIFMCFGDRGVRFVVIWWNFEIKYWEF